MKLGKKILTGLLIVVVAIIVLITVIIMRLDSIVAEGMRTFGTKATGTEVKVDSVSISLLGGDLAVNEFSVANPAGYKAKEAFSFDLVSVDLDMDSMFSDTIIVNEVLIDNVKIDFEPTLQGGSNLTDIKNNIMNFVKKEKDVDVEEPAEKEKAETEKKSKKVIIKKFIIKNGTVTVSSSILDQSVSLKMSQIELNDLGKESNMGETFSKIYEKILEEVMSVVSAANIKGLDMDKIQSTLFKDIPEGAGKVGEEVGKTLKDIGDKLF
jgi:hypothetical protein